MIKRQRLHDQWYQFSCGDHKVGVRNLGRCWQLYFRKGRRPCAQDGYCPTYRAAKLRAIAYLEKVETQG